MTGYVTAATALGPIVRRVTYLLVCGAAKTVRARPRGTRAPSIRPRILVHAGIRSRGGHVEYQEADSDRPEASSQETRPLRQNNLNIVLPLLLTSSRDGYSADLGEKREPRGTVYGDRAEANEQ